MASMRKLRRRLLRWQRYADRTYENPRISHPTGVLVLYGGHARALRAVHAERERRDPYRQYKPVCDVCGLPDPYGGRGDGIGSCDCPRCECGCARWSALCGCPDEDWGEEYEDDDPGPSVVTEWGLTEAGLL